MQLAWSRIWTRVVVSISYDDNHYTTAPPLDLEVMTLHIPQSSKTGASPSDGLLSYQGQSLWRGGLNPLQRYSRRIQQPQPTGLIKLKKKKWYLRFLQNCLALLAGAVKYTNSIYAVGECPHNEYSRYDTKQSDGKAPVMLELWGMWSTSSLPSLPCPL